MQHIAGKVRSGDSENMQVELPALLVPGGSCSSLCRPHGRDDPLPQHVEPLPDHVLAGVPHERSTTTALLRRVAGTDTGH